MTTFNSTLATFPAGTQILDTDLDNWHDSLAALDEAWTAYTPTWTTTGTAPSLGNGTLVGRYIQNGKLVIYRFCLTAGSTTTFGTNTWIISVPVTALDINQTGTAMLFDQSTNATRIAGNAVFNATTNLVFYAGNASGVVTATTPFTWANTDRLIVQITYEAA